MDAAIQTLDFRKAPPPVRAEKLCALASGDLLCGAFLFLALRKAPFTSPHLEQRHSA
ncbi:MAG: hypothetical protein WAU59_12505 [Rhodoplanes sp.]|jgi:hypothetical protein